jgi:hypothetical protein
VAALAIFQVVIAVLVFVNWDETVSAFVGHSFAPTRDAAEGAVLGTLVVHLLLAVLCVFLARAFLRGRRSARIRGTILLVATAVGGITAMGLPSQTYLSPIGVALAVVALSLLWLPASRRAFGELSGAEPR